jgi:hypothetical protein
MKEEAEKHLGILVLRMKEYSMEAEKHRNTCVEDERVLKRRKSI